MSDELPGMLAVAKGVAEQSFPHTIDAQVWCNEFKKQHPVPGEDTMLVWFANAIMAGYDTANARRSAEPFGWWDVFNECLHKDKVVADKCAEGGNTIIPLYQRP